MIAICAEHHLKADAGAFTLSQLKEFKENQASAVQGTFDWKRNQILAVVGGNLYFETPTMVEFRGQPLIWFDRDEHGSLLLSMGMLSTVPEPRLAMDRNDWLLLGAPTDFECPPSGRRIRASYANGDEVSVEFFELSSIEEAQKRYPSFSIGSLTFLPFPITAVELQMTVGGTEVNFGPHHTQVGGVHMTGCLMSHCRVGLSFS
jgi:hypothetical protein